MGAAGRRFDAVLVDIDNSRETCCIRHAALYSRMILAGGHSIRRVLALWSNDP